MCMLIVGLCMSVVPAEAIRGHHVLWLWAMVTLWELNWGPQQEQGTLSTAYQAPQPRALRS